MFPFSSVTLTVKDFASILCASAVPLRVAVTLDSAFAGFVMLIPSILVLVAAPPYVVVMFNRPEPPVAVKSMFLIVSPTLTSSRANVLAVLSVCFNPSTATVISRSFTTLKCNLITFSNALDFITKYLT